MLEPLFRCNLACAGCGKIDYPDDILNQRLATTTACRRSTNAARPPSRSPAASRCCIARCRKIVKGFVERSKFVILCTNALLLAKKIDEYQPTRISPGRSISTATRPCTTSRSAWTAPTKRPSPRSSWRKSKGFRTQINCTLFDDAEPERVAKFFDEMTAMGLDGITVSPGYAYERAPDQEHFLNRERTRKLFRDIFARGNGGKKWEFTQSELFLDFLAGNQTYECTPWSMPARTVFGWQKPCYLLGEGYVKTFKELMEDTEWEKYGVGNYEKCANCMVHCGFEGTAVADSVKHPLQAAAARAARGEDRRRRWRPTSHSRTSARRSSCSPATSRTS